MGVDEVVRQRPSLSSTPRQLWLYRELGLTPPKFYHLPLLLALRWPPPLKARRRPESREPAGEIHPRGDHRQAGLCLRPARSSPAPTTPQALARTFDWSQVPKATSFCRKICFNKIKGFDFEKKCPPSARGSLSGRLPPIRDRRPLRSFARPPPHRGVFRITGSSVIQRLAPPPPRGKAFSALPKKEYPHATLRNHRHELRGLRKPWKKSRAAVPGVASVAVSLLTNSMQVDYAPTPTPMPRHGAFSAPWTLPGTARPSPPPRAKAPSSGTPRLPSSKSA